MRQAVTLQLLAGPGARIPVAPGPILKLSFLFGRGGINTNHVWLANNHLYSGAALVLK